MTARAYRAFAAGQHADAADFARQILAEVPGDPGALTLIARLALAEGEPAIAHDVTRGLLDRFPGKAALWLDLVQALRDLGRIQQAVDAATRATALDPAREAPWIRLGEMRLAQNETELAAGAFRRALEIDPDCVAALLGLCQAAAIEPESATARRMRAMIASGTLPRRAISGLHYALARISRRAGLREPFLRHLFEANSVQRSINAAGRAEYEAMFDRLESAFTKEAFAVSARADSVDPRPIFILGMPRAGTTLVEQLLAGDANVHAGGELDWMSRTLRRSFEQTTGHSFPEGFEKLPASAMTALARAHAGRLRLVGQGSTYVTDKSPGNYHLLGLLRLLFPTGRIVHVARDPMDTSFSILQQQFEDRSPHTCDVNLLAYAYARYLRLMQRWQELFGDEFITVQYERLVESPAAEGRRVFGHCGLEWSDACLDFHRHHRPVRTFSASQVRQPIHSGSVGAWREFANELEPLRTALQTELARFDLAPLDS